MSALDEGAVLTFPSDIVDQFWSDIEPHLKRFEAETHLMSAEDIRRDVKNMEKQLWAFDDGEKLTGVAVTHVYETARGRICCIFAACGTESWPGQIDRVFAAIESWARALACVALEIRGRKGWKRVLPGFRETGVILEKEL